MTAITIGVSSIKELGQRTSAAFRGKKQGACISFASEYLLWKVLTPKRWALLKAIAEQDALAIREIARCVKRDVRAVRSDIHALLRSLHPSAGQRRRPYQRTFRQTPRLSRQYSCSKLSKGARQVTRAKGRRRELVVSAISVFEIVTLERRGRIAFKTSVTEWLTDVRRLPELTIHPVTAEIAERAGSLGEVFPGDPADRIIAATALVLGAALITHDTKLLGVPNLETIW